MSTLLVASCWVVLRGAIDEPYTQFRASDAIVQIGIASALMTLWILLLVFIVVRVRERTLPTAWLSALVVCALALFYLYHSPAGYLSDLVRWGAVVR